MKSDAEWQEYRPAVSRRSARATSQRELRLANNKVLQYECVALPDGGRMLTYFITQLKRIQEACARAWNGMTSPRKASNEALWDWDAATDVIYISPRFKAFFGLPTSASGLTPPNGKRCFIRTTLSDTAARSWRTCAARPILQH